MSFTINHADTTLAPIIIPDAQLDTYSTDLSLIGDNYDGFGTALNTNFVHLLENFANNIPPNNPLEGQLWYDSSDSKIKVYNGSTFIAIGSATISPTQPPDLTPGDIWLDTTNDQLFFIDTVGPMLVGPSYNASQGLSGFQVSTILDSIGQKRTITSLYNNNTLIGIFASNSFVPATPIAEFSGSLSPGFNASTNNVTFNVTCANANTISNIPIQQLIRADKDGIINGGLGIRGSLNLSDNINNPFTSSIQVYNGTLEIINTQNSGNFRLLVRNNNISAVALDVITSTSSLDIFPGNTSSNTNIGGNLLVNGNSVINGNLTINGVYTSTSSTVISVSDKTVNLASNSSTDSASSGGGVILNGSSNHVILWANVDTAATGSLPELAPNAWTSSEDFNLATGKSYKIAGAAVLTANSLTSAITSAPGLNTIGTLSSLSIGPSSSVTSLSLNNSTVAAVGGLNLSLTSLGGIDLYPATSSNIILHNNPNIQGLKDPALATDAANKNYVDNVVGTHPLVFSIDVSDIASDTDINHYIASTVLLSLAPPTSYKVNVTANILCSKTILNIVSNVSNTTTAVLTSSGTAQAVTSITNNNVQTSASNFIVTRYIKQFQSNGTSWSFVSSIAL
jgi:hypothetical protein